MTRIINQIKSLTEKEQREIYSLLEKSLNKNNVKKHLVVGITSCKAGVGKSLIAINLSKHLSILKKVPPLLIDLSHPFGGTSGFVNKSTESWNTIRPLLTETVSSKKFATVTTKTNEGFNYLAAPQNMGENKKLSKGEFANLVKSARIYSNLTVVDLPTISDEDDLEKLNDLDEIFCIVTPEPEVLMSTSKIQVFQKTRSTKSWKYILNRWDRDKSPKLENQIVKKLGTEIFASIEEDADAVWEHYFSGKLFTNEDLVLTRDFKNLAALISNLISQ